MIMTHFNDNFVTEYFAVIIIIIIIIIIEFLTSQL